LLYKRAQDVNIIMNTVKKISYDDSGSYSRYLLRFYKLIPIKYVQQFCWQLINTKNIKVITDLFVLK